MRRTPFVDRGDERLRDRDGAVVGAGVAPALERVRFRDDPVGQSTPFRRHGGRGRSTWPTLPSRSPNFRSAGAVKTGLPPRMTRISTCPASIACASSAMVPTLPAAPPFRYRPRRSPWSPAFPSVLVHRPRSGVHRRRLIVAGDDDRTSLVRQQILGERGDPFRFVALRGPGAATVPPAAPAPTAAASRRANPSISEAASGSR